MKTIWAILNQPKGRGNDRYWAAFKVIGEDLCQADVEDLMIRLHYSTSQYFLSLGKDFIEDGFLLRYPEAKRKFSHLKMPWVNYEEVHFELCEGNRSFVFIDVCDVSTEGN